MAALTGAGAALARAVRAALAQAGSRCALERIDSRPWASITYSGERHVLRLRLRLDGDGAAAAADAFVAGLAEREFELRGHIVADIALVSSRRDREGVRLVLEALTVEAA